MRIRVVSEKKNRSCIKFVRVTRVSTGKGQQSTRAESGRDNSDHRPAAIALQSRTSLRAAAKDGEGGEIGEGVPQQLHREGGGDRERGG